MNLYHPKIGTHQNTGIKVRVAIIFTMLLTVLTPDGMARAAAIDLANPFAACDCVNLGYDSAPESLQRLIQWTLGVRFEGYPEPPQGWLNWSAAYWPDNIRNFGPLLDYRLDWNAAVNHTPEVGALVVWSGGSTVTWTVDGYRQVYTHGPAGHLAVVTAYDPAANTISVQEKNWVTCSPPERQNIDVSDAMTFIHEPKPIYADEVGGGVPAEEKVEPTGVAVKPLVSPPNLWGKTSKQSELYPNRGENLRSILPSRCTNSPVDHMIVQPFQGY